MKHYAERDLMTLGQYYTDHVDAMTAEGLHSKSDISAELAHRDMLIDKLADALGGMLRYTNKGNGIGMDGRQYAIAADKALALLDDEPHPQPTKRFVSALERNDVWTSRKLPADDTTPASE